MFKLQQWLLRLMFQNKTERHWGMYDSVPQIDMETILHPSKRVLTGGLAHSELTADQNHVPQLRSLMVIYLDHNTSIKDIVETIEHEALHVAVNMCIVSQHDFVEIVIEGWMMGTNRRRYDAKKMIVDARYYE